MDGPLCARETSLCDSDFLLPPSEPGTTAVLSSISDIAVPPLPTPLSQIDTDPLSDVVRTEPSPSSVESVSGAEMTAFSDRRPSLSEPRKAPLSSNTPRTDLAEPLRLPCFAMLGINAPTILQSPMQRPFHLITPPADDSLYSWSIAGHFLEKKAILPPFASASVAAGGDALNSGEGNTTEELTPGVVVDPDQLMEFETESVVSSLTLSEDLEWLRGAISVLESTLQNTATFSTDTLKVLSHALPCPTVPGHNYNHFLAACQRSISPAKVMFVNLMHAIPRRNFSLDDLPTSPPTTPGPAIGGEDYFTAKIFDSAVSATDYSSDLPLQRASQGLVPPASVHMSIVERYIPPSSALECADMFNASGRSLLVDRLFELSSNNGCLAFIYPTRQGAQMFSSEFLAPVLDPVLRQLTVMHNFGADFSRRIGTMEATQYMLDMSTLTRRAQRLCDDMAGKTVSSTGSTSTRTEDDVFELVHSAAHTVQLSRDLLGDWYLKQEKPRIRKTVADYMASRARTIRPQAEYRGGRGSAAPPETPEPQGAGIVHALINNFSQNLDRAAETVGIEVAVLVIKRSTRKAHQ